MIESERIHRLAEAIDKYSGGDGMHETRIPGLSCLRFSAPGDATPAVYQPSLCVIAQGAKQVLTDGEIYRYAPSQYLAVSVDLPVFGQVTEASARKPYLCLKLDIDGGEIRDLLAQMGDQPGSSATAAVNADTVRGIFVGDLDLDLMESILRLARLLDAPKDIPLLAPMAKREVLYRLLAGPHGNRIAHLGVPDGNMQRIVRVLGVLKRDFARPMRVEELADIASMSLSSFHHHFKQVTAMSPVQYQKRLRLMEARRVLLTEDTDAASTAYRVGYESPSQFSREYARMFGAPPVRDAMELRRSGAAAWGVA